MGIPDNCNIIFKYRGTDVRFRLKPSPDYISDCIRRDSFFFDYKHMYEALRDVPRDASVVDVGAHIGSMSVWFARVAEARRIVAIEPDDEHYGMLVDNISLNGLSDLITPVRAAVGATCGRAVCQFRSSKLTALNMYRVADAGPVAAVTLDSLVEQGVITDADVLKIDVEGYECAVLEGASLFFERFSPVILAEVWSPGKKPIDPHFDVRANNRRFFSLAAALGYRVARRYQSNEDYLLVRESPKSTCVLQLATAHMRPDAVHTSVANDMDMSTGSVPVGNRSTAGVTAASGLTLVHTRRLGLRNSTRTADDNNSCAVAMWDRFDFRAVCHFSGRSDRLSPLRAEFNRVGLADVVEFWGAPDPFIPLLSRSLRCCSLCARDPRMVAVTLKHQQMVRAAYDIGANFGLFMEDDILFLRDTELLRASVEHAPSDADVLLFEWIAPWGPAEFHERIKARESGDYWYRFGRTGVLNCGCYALSRKAMAVMLRILEGPADGQALFDACDRHWPVLSDESGLSVYVSSPVACIQDEAKHRHAYDAVGAGRDLYGA